MSVRDPLVKRYTVALVILGLALLGVSMLGLKTSADLRVEQDRAQAAEFVAWLGSQGQAPRGPEAQDNAITAGRYLCEALRRDDDTARRALAVVYTEQPTQHAANTFISGAVTYFCQDREDRLLTIMGGNP